MHDNDLQISANKIGLYRHLRKREVGNVRKNVLDMVVPGKSPGERKEEARKWTDCIEEDMRAVVAVEEEV